MNLGEEQKKYAGGGSDEKADRRQLRAIPEKFAAAVIARDVANGDENQTEEIEEVDRLVERQQP